MEKPRLLRPGGRWQSSRRVPDRL